MKSAPRVLEGTRVLDLTSNLAGPTTTMILASLGASVIKVERPGGEDARMFTPSVDGRGIMFDWANRGKRSIVIDLQNDAGVAALTRLLRSSDILIHSLRPGIMEKFGFSREQVREINPRVIYADIGAFGAEGADIPKVGYDALVQAYTGIMLANGNEGDPPIRTAPSAIDIGTGQWMALAIIVAIMARGKGQDIGHIEATLFDTAMSLMPDQAIAARLSGESPPRYGSGNLMSVPYAAYRCGDGHVFIAAPNERLWRKLAIALGRERLLEDPRFLSSKDRQAHREEVRIELEAVLETRNVSDWLRILEQAGVPAGPVNRLSTAVSGPAAAARRTFSDDDIPAVRLPILVDGEALGPIGVAPRAGEHTSEILLEAGLDTDEIQTLIAGGVVFESAPTLARQ